MSAALVAQNVSFTYPDGQLGLSEVNLTVQPGERLALIGPSGAGKSTLLHLAAGVAEGKQEGSLEIEGVAVTHRTAKKLRSRVGIVFQETDDQLFMPTVGDDVGFGPRAGGLRGKLLQDRVDRALVRVGLAGFDQRSPRRLSGGEKRRASLATVIAMDVSLLALDEPTANLDPRARRHIAELLRTLPETMLIATHDLLFVKRVATTCVIMDSGKTVATGPTEEILGDEPLLEAHGLA